RPSSPPATPSSKPPTGTSSARRSRPLPLSWTLNRLSATIGFRLWLRGMPLFFGNKPRLRPSILTAFIVLTVPVFVTIITVTYFSNDRIARQSAAHLIERYHAAATENIEDDINPIKSMVRAAAALGDATPDFYSTDASIPFFRSMVLHSETIVSAYVGLSDRGFHQS